MTENPTAPQRLRNIVIAAVAILLSATLFFSLQTENGSSSLAQQAANATPLDVAVNNGKPTLVEFYANWCTSCQAMAADLAQVKADYGDRLNFVMLNVDNPKWLPEVLQYDVDGIPHFVYLDGQGQAIAQSIGEQPLSILEADLGALIAAEPLPYANANGRTSAFTPSSTPSPSDPRSHGAQVQAS
ncbi:thioredoxin family protein [Spirulina sp. CCNP1310]|uniref:thioredoxin family protein n=1 Tax=Spirulina sp. CCNP1310 TaxID=3110249 RepID=UPI002B206CF7|nr:thioredoxin family protein [Spirulina sp. CCNP1310]MEA5417788.1 thioredoxin family protein [Spirulina sp. CCNP1310]